MGAPLGGTVSPGSPRGQHWPVSSRCSRWRCPCSSATCGSGRTTTACFPTNSTQYRAWELQSQKFGAGSPNPFLMVAEFPTTDTQYKQQIANVQKAMAATPGVAAVSPAQYNSTTAPTMGVFSLTPDHDRAGRGHR